MIAWMCKYLSNAFNSLAIYEISCDFDLTCVIRFIFIVVFAWSKFDVLFVFRLVSLIFPFFLLRPFCGWKKKRYITVVFFFQKMTLWNTLEFHFLLGWIWKYLLCQLYFRSGPYLIFDVTWGQIWDSCRRQIVVFFCDKSTPSCMSKIFTFFKIGLVVKTISVLTTIAAVIFSN
jgi:hypothetical protein